MWSISNPGFHCPVQIGPDKGRHFLFHWPVASLLRRHGVALGLDTRPFRNLIDELCRSLGKQVLVLYRPHVGNSFVLLDRQKVSNLVRPHFHNIVIRLSTAIISHFIKGLMFRIQELVIIMLLVQGFHLTRDDIPIIKVFLTRRGQIVPSIRANALHRPGRRQEFFPFVIAAKGQVGGGVVWHVLHGLEPVIGISELRNDQRVVGVAIVAGVLKPVLVARKFRFDFE